jgi:hypothetical protein
MAGTYKLSARLNPKCKVDMVTFFAESDTDFLKWDVISSGQFEKEINMLLPTEITKQIAAKLRQGEEVEIPGRFHEIEFWDGFSCRMDS